MTDKELHDTASACPNCIYWAPHEWMDPDREIERVRRRGTHMPEGAEDVFTVRNGSYLGGFGAPIPFSSQWWVCREHYPLFAS